VVAATCNDTVVVEMVTAGVVIYSGKEVEASVKAVEATYSSTAEEEKNRCTAYRRPRQSLLSGR